MSVRVLAVSDEVDARLYRSGLAARPARPDLLIACGDLPAYYLDYLVSELGAPMYAVHGNHDPGPDSPDAGGLESCGASWLGGRSVYANGLLLAGFDGSLRYSRGPYQSSQREMLWRVRRLVPRLWLNRWRYGRFVDVLVTHAPALGIHDQPDLPHRGFAAFRWLLETFRPAYHLHGHIHRYDSRTPTRTRFGGTEVVNVCPVRELTLDLDLPVRARARPA